MAVDMRIGEGAEVFVWNGFSSLTSNIVMLRLARGLEPETTRFLMRIGEGGGGVFWEWVSRAFFLS
ncbi:hypothetical protein C8R46DRAFT_1135889 [Mycena filopes]|nr:hypothetical protein C8R46DRAFT_1135889 [Mycena filopes]